MKSALKLSDRVCLITGASRGLGAKLAQLFWREGASLCLCSRDRSALQQVIEALPPPAGGAQECIAIACDLSERGQTAAVVERAASLKGWIDVLVNNAAVQGPIGPLCENSLEDWEHCCRVNLIAPVMLCAAVIPWMKTRGGKIINLSGGGATSPRPNFTAYAASKTALVRLSETLAQETRELGIEVNCVAPGVMPTTMLSDIAAAGPVKAGNLEYDQAQKSGAEGEEVMDRAARLCLYLASSESAGITGRLISARWDRWEELSKHLEELRNSDIYTLRRIVPADRGRNWGERE